jgi:hypothetical protein
MGTHLAAVGAVDLAHLLLDEGMTGLAHDGHAAQSLHHVNGVPRQARIVDDARARLLDEKALG